MSTQLDERGRTTATNHVARRLLLVWRNPQTRRLSPVAQLNQLESGRFVFSYLDGARDEDGFYPLDEFPDLARSYVSDALPAFFANRVMSADRASYREYLDRLGLAEISADDVPMEVLVRSGGGRATDTFHIVESPLAAAEQFTSRFFVSGISHIDGATALADRLQVGDQLGLRREPANPANPRAVLLDAAEGRPIGWVPDWLCDHVSELIEGGYELRAVAEQVNLNAPIRQRILCRIDARR